MDLTGKVIAILPANSGVSQRTGNPWMSQEYVIEVPGQYPRKCMFRIFGEDRIKQFNLQQNDEVRVSFHVEAHEYNGRWFNEIRLDGVTFIGASTAKAPQPAVQQPTSTTEAAQQPANEEQQPTTEGKADDLPF